MPERLLDHHPGVFGEAGFAEPADHFGEQERRDLEVEDRPLGVADGLLDALEGRVFAVVAGDVLEPRTEADSDVGLEEEQVLVRAAAVGTEREAVARLKAPLGGAPLGDRRRRPSGSVAWPQSSNVLEHRKGLRVLPAY